MLLLALLQATVLGIVEGITEFLPISSTGHLIVAGRLVGFEDPNFEIFIQFGAICAVLVMYRRDLWQRLCTGLRGGPNGLVLWNVVLAFLPAAVLGLLFHHHIKHYLFNPFTVALALIVGGLAIIALERRGLAAQTHDLDTMTARQALAVGIGQVLAMWPGFSRAAASILGGMVAGCDRRTATLFSFYLAIPTMLGATVVALASAGGGPASGGGATDQLALAAQLPTYTVGFVVSFGIAWLAIRGLLRYIAHHDFTAFGKYRIGLGAALLLMLWAGWL
ncbi:MAG: undecaprenyl-diphosphate phosphatase [Deltaproteobacteria bacterium]|nr:undecaprenyl-diphosphate phosphatase [Deltaproteobacteria bacterium]